MLNFALFAESNSTRQKVFFFLREVSTAHTCAGGEHTHRAFHIRYYIITAGHGRRPAIRVSERVRPTADLAPLTSHQVEKLIHSRNPSMTRCTGAGNKGNKKAWTQRRQHRVSFTQQASGLQPFPTHRPQRSHLCQELGRCCQQD